MKNNKWLIWGLIGFTAILLVTAVVLFFQLRQPAPTPTPKPKPSASPQLPSVQEITANICQVSFTVAPSPSPSPSPSASPLPSPSPAPTACFDTCDSDAQCESDLRCMTVGSTKRCVNPSCTEDADCICVTASPSPSPSPGASASPQAAASPKPPASPLAQQPSLPQAGGSAPMILGVSAGILMMLVGLLWL
ncbi:hypothetical protein KKH13_01275 [Patescibacteria group bacterium]|nr:hypothetical protein [Patescibacteria group bacterium]